MITVTEFAFTAYPVTDLVRARRFYEGLFHLKPTMVYENGGMGWVEYDVGGATFALSNISAEWKPSAQGPCIAFEVDDFDGAIAAIRAAGHTFKFEPMTTGGCQMAGLLDSEGNSLTVHKRLKK